MTMTASGCAGATTTPCPGSASMRTTRATSWCSGALIRAYEVFDVKTKNYLTCKNGKFLQSKDGKDKIITQSTYIYNIINGFFENNINWVDQSITTNDIIQKGRQNVYKSKFDEEYVPVLDSCEKKIKDVRLCSFSTK